MKYQVIARKFRPQVFEDVVGQKPIVQTLKNAIEMGRIGHAYLFSGPRGVGKTTTARLLAKGLNCVQGSTSLPCNQCPSCQEISNGQSIDVLEIDAASNTGVDNIRELRENARYVPSRDRYKVFIIDEVHMLSTSAFNALLKILEEPPPHVIFIMATTERHKVPATILSRCQQLVFRTILPAETHAHLKEIAGREGIKIGDGALDYIVKAAEGSMRDAQSLLDQIISFSGQEIVDEDVRDVLGFIPSEILDRAVDALAARDSKTLLDIVEVVVDQGFSLQQYVREFLGRIRDLLLVKLGIPEKVLSTAEEKKSFETSAQRFSEQDLIRFFDMLLRLENEMRWTSQPRFHLEVGCVKLAKVGHLRDIEEVIRELKQTDAHSDFRLTPSPTPIRTQPEIPPPKPAQPQSFADRFRQRVEEKSDRTSVYLQKADRIEKVGDRIEITLSNAAVATTLESKEHRSVLEAVGAELVGKPTSVSLIMAERSVAPQGSPPESPGLRESAEKEPLVQAFIDVFRGDLAQVKPAKPAE